MGLVKFIVFVYQYFLCKNRQYDISPAKRKGHQSLYHMASTGTTMGSINGGY